MFGKFRGNSNDYLSDISLSSTGPVIEDGKSVSLASTSTKLASTTGAKNTSLGKSLKAEPTRVTATCYKRLCPDEYYTTSPNTSFFYTLSATSIKLCYKENGCNLKAGAYASTPNTSFFITVKSTYTGRTCWRGTSCSLSAGAYSSTPNTAFFKTVSSNSSGSRCYRGTSCNITGGSYTSAPNTAFFKTVMSKASGSTCWRGTQCNPSTGAYTTSPSTTYFNTVQSKASGSTCYRATGCNTSNYATTSANRNTIVFSTFNSSSATGYTCYQGASCNTAKGYYSSVSTAYFKTSAVNSALTTCYRGTQCNQSAGAYTTTPNTLFFVTNSSSATGITCWRGTSCSASAGSYTASPNTSFFITVYSKASGSTCYRATNCHIKAGAYSASPNTSFFITVHSKATGKTCWRGTSCNFKAGAYASSPNTSFFITVYSKASGSTCWRATQCNATAGAVTTSPNTTYFTVSTSKASGSTCYRVSGCNNAKGYYASKPNTAYFTTNAVKADSQTCYYATGCAQGYTQTGSGTVVASSGNIKCYQACPSGYFYSSMWPSDTVSVQRFSYEEHDTLPGCYTAECQTGNGYYASTSSINTNIFGYSYVDDPNGTGMRCYYPSSCKNANGYYSSSSQINTSYFVTNSVKAGSQTCYYALRCNYVNTGYESLANGPAIATSGSVGCYLADCAKAGSGYYYYSEHKNATEGALTFTPHSTYQACYKEACNNAKGYYSSSSYTSAIDTNFFKVSHTYQSATNCYFATSCNTSAYATTTNLNTSYFVVDKKSMTKGGTTSSFTCYKPTGCQSSYGYYSSISSIPTTLYETSSVGTNEGYSCHYVKGCNNYYGYYSSSSSVSTTYFSRESKSDTGGGTCYFATSCASDAVNVTNFPYASLTFTTNTETMRKAGTTSDIKCNIATGCAASQCSYTSASNINTSFFTTSSSTKNGHTCYYVSGCKSSRLGGYYSKLSVDTDYFTTSAGPECGNTQCVKVTGCKSPYVLNGTLNSKTMGNIVCGKSSNGCPSAYPYYYPYYVGTTGPTQNGFNISEYNCTANNGMVSCLAGCYKVTCASNYVLKGSSNASSTCYTETAVGSGIQCCTQTSSTSTSCPTHMVLTVDIASDGTKRYFSVTNVDAGDSSGRVSSYLGSPGYAVNGNSLNTITYNVTVVPEMANGLAGSDYRLQSVYDFNLDKGVDEISYANIVGDNVAGILSCDVTNASHALNVTYPNGTVCLIPATNLVCNPGLTLVMP